MSDYYTLKVKEVVKETDDAVTVHFKQPLFKKVKYSPGQFLTLIVPINGKKERRSYSMSSTPNIDNTVAITVKRVEGGLVSNHVNDQIKAGDSIEIMQPMGNFTLESDKSKKRHIVLFGAGSGITPLMSILKSTLYFEPESNVSLIYGNRTEDSIIFQKALDNLKDKFGERLNVVHSLSQPSKQWGGYQGRIDQVKTVNILNLLPKFSAENTEYFLCGPEGMMDEVKAGLSKLKVPTHKIYTESFVASTADQADVAEGSIETRTVKVILNGEEHAITVPPEKSILDTALDEGLDMPFSCQSGLCTACMGRKHSGEIRMVEGDGLSEDEINQGYVLLCVGHPMTDDVVVEIE